MCIRDRYTQAQIDRANAVNLEDFLRSQGETLIKSGREYRWKEHDSLTIRGKDVYKRQGVDSARGDDDFTPFRNIMNEYYARDTSRKIPVSYTHLFRKDL